MKAKPNSANKAKSNRYDSLKWLLVFTLLLDLAMNVLVFAWLLSAGTSLRFWIFSAVASGFDVLFLALVFISNFRFRYGLALFLPFAFAAAALCVLSALAYHGSDAMDGVSQLVFFFLRFLSFILLIAGYCTAARDPARHKRWALALLTALCAVFAAAVVFDGIAYTRNGFFGQGNEGVVRPIVYEYDGETDSYTAAGVLEGRGDTIVLSDTFNGKKVNAVDCSVFGAEGIKTAEFVGGADFTLQSASALSQAAPDLKIHARKDNIDKVRALFYENGSAEGAFSLGNRVIPTELGRDEVFITFAYDEIGYERFGGDVLGTWFGESGDVFDAQEYFDRYEFFRKSDTLSDGDLDWSFRTLGGYIFTGLNVDGESIVGKRVTESMEQVSLSFSKIYRVFVGEDNDSGSYEIPQDFLYSSVEGKKQDFRYVVGATADGWIASLERRGFDLRWKKENGSLQTPLGVLSEELSALQGSDLRLVPEWTMKAPSFSEVKTTRPNNSVMYGEEIGFSAAAFAANPAFTLTYDWQGGGKNRTESAFTVDSIAFDEGGAYVCTVTSHAADSSLTSTASQRIDVEVTRRKVTMVWDVPGGGDGWTYTGTDHRIGVTFGEGDVIGGDELDWNVSDKGTGVFNDASKRDGQILLRNAGSYVLSLSLTGAQAERYEIGSGSQKSVVIGKKSVAPVWDEENGKSYPYDGTRHAPSASASGVGEDGSLTLTHTVAGTLLTGGAVSSSENAGNYTVTASFANDKEGNNYALEDGSRTFSVTAQEIRLTAWQTDAYVYDGTLQHPTVSDATGNIVAGERNDLLWHGFNYLITTEDVGGQKEHPGVYAGSYTVRAELVAYNGYLFGNNYYISAEGKPSQDFEIGKRPITVGWSGEDGLELVFNGTPQAPSVTSVGNAVAADSDALQRELNASLDFRSHIDAASYSVTAEISNVNYKWQDGETHQISYSISPKPVAVQWEGGDFIYNGELQAPAARRDGLCNDDAFTVSVRTDGAAGLTDGGAKNVGSYIATASCTKNYTLSEEEKRFTIGQRAITLGWDADSFVYNGDAQAPRVLSIGNGVQKEEAELISNLNATRSFGGNVDVGGYSVSVTLSDGNYSLAEPSQSYIITQMSVDVVWDAAVTRFTYDGGMHTLTASATGAKGAELSLGYRIEGGSALKKDVGVYTVEASVQDESGKNYSLRNAEMQFEIAARLLTVVWTDASDYTYCANPIAPSAKTEGAAEGEEPVLAFTVSGDVTDGQAVNAGTYTIEASLSSAEVNKNYTLGARVTRQFTIAKRTVAVQWGNNSFVYSGGELCPQAESLSGDADGDKIPLSALIYSGAQKNAGTDYSASVRTDASYAKNYELTGTSCTFSIAPATISLIWSETELVYSGSARHPSVRDYTGDVIFEKESLLSGGILYSSEGGKNVGSYSVRATLAASGNYANNYTIADGTDTCGYEITACEVTLKWNTGSYVYNGTVQTPTAVLQGTIGTDSPVLVYTYTRGGSSAASPSDAGSYTVTAALASDTVSRNYRISGSDTQSFEIAKRSLTLVWDSVRSFVYNGRLQHPSVTDADAVASEKTRFLQEGIAYTITRAGGSRLSLTDGVDAGSYQIEARLTDAKISGNYTLQESKGLDYTITKASVRVVWKVDGKETASVLYNGVGHTVTASFSGADGREISLSVAVTQPSGLPLAGAPTAPGSYTAAASFADADGLDANNYSLQNATFVFAVEMPPEEQAEALQAGRKGYVL